MHGWCLKLILPTDTSLNSQSPVYFEEIHTNINLQKIRQLLFYLSSISNFMRANYPKQALNQQICLLPALGGFCAPQSPLCLGSYMVAVLCFSFSLRQVPFVFCSPWSPTVTIFIQVYCDYMHAHCTNFQGHIWSRWKTNR